jgi:hypothetical protein
MAEECAQILKDFFAQRRRDAQALAQSLRVTS